MIGFTQTTGYAILAMVCLEGCGDRLIQAKDLAECTGIPKPYLSKILHKLGRAGLIHTRRGPGGGVGLTRATDQISLVDVAEALEGSGWLPSCLLGFESSMQDACPLHPFWQQKRREIETRLESLTLRDVVLHMERHGSRRLLPQCDGPPEDHGGRRDGTEPQPERLA